MKWKELVEYIEKNAEEIEDIEIEDYNGNTICKLQDLDIADFENNVLRLQIQVNDISGNKIALAIHELNRVIKITKAIKTDLGG